ncbi:4-hydroxyphenylpyruvate dioxygenase [Dendronalium sp. ChiSLP03b]|uniref:4-hydroxyphenylpyruvate dioxygenase n=1 Tax=Dendronalium sp. ChiSLP03b TaxID=3075381 RepID=UPI002AD58618|nr:4-hydroxyphenylpyruvate dioxygenase [Dendronalium sp. ChiSLP03b]MDZ8205912.1 4-hydroxyphenylpyruvate dioxygenase [Dendronalium sp. ChiSLP03b]
MNDFCPIKRFDHLELYVGNAKQAALFYSKFFGFTNTGYRGLETGSREVASYVMQQGDICFVLSTALFPEHPISQSVLKHGDGVAIIALEVPDVVSVYKETTKRGAMGAMEPTEEEDGYGVLRYAAIHGYGDTLIKFVERSDYSGVFAPGFMPCQHVDNSKFVGLHSIDHVVGNVELGMMNRWVQFFGETMGFSLLVHFDDQAISTEYSALMSKVVQDGTGKIKLPINEPAQGKRKSQIEEYLRYNNGPGVQHVACATNNIIETVSLLKTNGVEFLDVPRTYYENLEKRVGKINEPIEKLAELGILVDRDEDGYLLQIFTQPVQDRPTLFFEVIERHGAQGFGEGNFKSLFEAIEREQALRGNL